MFRKKIAIDVSIFLSFDILKPLPVAYVFYKHKRCGMQQQQVHMLAKTMIANHVKLEGGGQILCQSDIGY